MDTTETIFSLAIAIIYPFFFTKLTNKVLDFDSINNMCSEHYGKYFYPSYAGSRFVMGGGFGIGNNKPPSEEEKAKEQEAEQCRKAQTSKLDDANFKQHIMLIAIAFIGILATSAIQTHSTKFGVGLGGIFTLMIALLLYWDKYGETAKLGVLGASLALLLFLSVRLYKMNSIVDLFSLTEYGAK
jgi:hypothetical protein